MIDEYLKQTLVSTYKDPTFTIVISSLDSNEECDHEEIIVGLTQYNPNIYDLFKEFYIQIKELSTDTADDLYAANEEATAAVDDFFNLENNNLTINTRKLLLRSGLEYDNDQKAYRSVLNGTLTEGTTGSADRIKSVITSEDSDVFTFKRFDNIGIPLYLKTDYNEPLTNQILMITLMNKDKENIFDHKIILVTDRNGHAVYYPTALPTQADQQDYMSAEGFYHANSFFYQDGVPRYLYYMKVDYPGTENYELSSKLFTIYIAKGRIDDVDITSTGVDDDGSL